MTRRFQFSLASLLFGIAIVAVAVNWWTLRQRMIVAKQRFDEAVASYEAGVVTMDSVVGASKELLQAELAMPFVPSDRVAWLSYLDRTRHLQRKTRATAIMALFGSMEDMVQMQRRADGLLDECDSVENRLGLLYVDNDYFRAEDGRYAYAADDDEDGAREAVGKEIAPPAPGN